MRRKYVYIILALLLCSLVFTGCKPNDKVEDVNKTDQVTDNPEPDINKDFVSFKPDTTGMKLEKIDISPSYAIDGELKSISDNSKYIVLARVLDKGESFIDNVGGLIQTPIKIETLKILKGDDKVNVKSFLQTGGIVTLKEYADKNLPESNEKAGYDKLSEEELTNTYVEMYPAQFKHLKKDGVYVLFLDGGNTETLFNIMDAYSTFEFDGDYQKSSLITKDTDTSISFKQEALGKTYTLTDIEQVISDNSK